MIKSLKMKNIVQVLAKASACQTEYTCKSKKVRKGAGRCFNAITLHT